MSFGQRIQRLNRLIRGWLNYFKLANIHGKLQAMDSWLRKRLRYCIWHHWKKPERKRKNLMRLGVNPEDAYVWSPDSCRDGRLASHPKPHPENDYYLGQDEEKGLYRYVGTLSPDQAKVTNRRIRDPYPEPSGVVCPGGMPLARGALR